MLIRGSPDSRTLLPGQLSGSYLSPICGQLSGLSRTVVRQIWIYYPPDGQNPPLIEGVLSGRGGIRKRKKRGRNA